MKIRPALIGVLLEFGCEERSTPRLSGDAGTFPDAVDARVDAGPSGVGAPCSDERETVEATRGCRGGQYCLTSARGFPRGYCTVDCLQTPCPGDSYCVADGSRRYCMRACDDDGACRVGDGYVCARPSPFLPPGCTPDPSPLGRGDDGNGCFPSAQLPTGVFDGASTSVSLAREDSLAEVDPSMAISPRDGTVAVAYTARTMHPDWFAGLSVQRGGDPLAPWETRGVLEDLGYDSVLAPSLGYTPDGTLLGAYLAVTYDWPQPAVRVARSSDDGRSWDRGTDIPPPNRCAGGCDPPVLAVGPRVEGGWRACAVYVTRNTRSEAMVTVQCSDDGARWSQPVVAGAVERPVDEAGRPTIFIAAPLSPAVHIDARGAVHVAWLVASRANARAALGDAHNGVRYARSDDGGGSFGPVERVSAPGEPVVGHAPTLATAGDVTGLAYVRGEGDGRWDVVLATRTGGAWRARRVNDDPRTCATHGFVGMAAERDRFHLLWLENRAGEGTVAYARCAAAADACAPNERVSDTRFRLSTGDDPARWHGTRAALAVDRRGVLRAAWSDSRSGGPAIYVARGVSGDARDGGTGP